jgi:hypothetical protein
VAIILISVIFFISYYNNNNNNVLALAQNKQISNNQNPNYNYNYNIKPGSWVRYAINGPNVHSDNKLLELMGKGILSSILSRIPSADFAGSMTDKASLSSTNDIEWLQHNITGISGDNVTIQNEIKPYGKQPIIFKPVSWSISNSASFFILPKNVKIGERFPSNSNSSFSPSLIVNRTIQKNIGGHNVAVYEITGQRNSFNSTSNFATQVTRTSYYDKVTGLPLQDSFDFKVGSPIFGTVTGSMGWSAIDWSGRVGR